VLNDKKLREELRAKGFARKALFSWERCARETYAAYGKASEIRRGR
jgi:glycosyltransferase involved in cell wall biosynthesis